jgi:phage-related protein
VSVQEKFAQLELKSSGVGNALTNAFAMAQPIIDWLIDVGIPLVVGLIGDILIKATEVYNFIAANWTQIAPWVEGIGVAIASIVITMKAYQAATWLCNTATAAWTTATNIAKWAQTNLSLAKAKDIIDSGIIHALYLKDAIVKGASAVKTGVLTAATWAQNIATGVLTGAQWLLNAAFLASPIGWIVLGVGLIVGAFILLWKKSEGFRNFWIGMWNGIKAIFAATWEGIKKFCSSGIGQVILMITMPIIGLVNFIIQNWAQIKAVTVAVFQAIDAFFVNVWNGIKTTFTTVFTAIGTFFTNAWNGYIAIVTTAMTWIRNVLTTIWTGITAALTAAWEWLGGLLSSVWNGYVTIVTNVCNTIWSVVQTIWNGITGFLSATWNAISTTATNVFTAIKDTIVGIWNGIVGGIKGAINLIINAINTFLSGITAGINGVTGTLNKVTGAFGIPAIPEAQAPQIPTLANGGLIRKAGSVIVGENAPELLNLPRGASVTPLEEAGATQNIEVNINGVGLGVDEILQMLVPKLKFAIANM